MVREIIGPIPRGNDLYDREELIRNMWNIVKTQDIFLVGPRRYGKSGIMCRMYDKPEDRFKVMFIDCEKLEDPYEFFASLLIEVLKNKSMTSKIKDSTYPIPLLPEAIFNKFKENISEIELTQIKITLRDTIEKQWKEESLKCIKEIDKLANKNNQTILFLLDEFPSLLKHMIDNRKYTETRLFLEFFRSIRLDLNLENVRFIIAGSRNIYTIYRNIPQLLLDNKEISENEITSFPLTQVFNDFRKEMIEPFDTKTAKKFIVELFKSDNITVKTDIVDKVLNVASPVPYFIQLLISEIKRHHDGDITAEAVEKIYRERILGPTCRFYFEYYEERLREYGTINEKCAKAIVVELSKAGKLTRDELYNIFILTAKKNDTPMFDHLMSDLEMDFYIKLDSDNRYSFASKILSDWWLRWHTAPKNR